MTLPPFLVDRGCWAAAACGALLPLSFEPFGLFWLAPFLVAGLFLLWDRQSPRAAAGRGFAFGLAAFIAGTYWLYISIYEFGGAPIWLAVILTAAVAVAMGLFFAGAGWCAARFAASSLPLNVFLIWPAAWLLFEWLRGWVLTGFPWLSLGYGQIDGPLAVWAPLAGVYGVSLVTAVTAGCVVALFHTAGAYRQRAFAVLGALALATGLLYLPAWTQTEGEAQQVALVQGSISQDRKWLPRQRLPTLELYRELTVSAADARLVVWPEVAVPAMQHMVQPYLEDLAALVRSRDQQLLLGILSFDFDREQYYNSLLAIGPDAGVYHKRHLVPFGEFFPVPSFVRRWMRMMSLPYQDAARGARDQAPLRSHGTELSPSICYEDAFGAEQRDFLPRAGMLVNVSNDAWFGDSIAPHQHLQIARMRALETGRPMLRATNTGITALINYRGEIVAAAPQFETTVVTGLVQPRAGATPFVRFGNAPVIALSLAVLGVAWLVSRGRA